MMVLETQYSNTSSLQFLRSIGQRIKDFVILFIGGLAL
jgi:hypothetical protein